jgi:hypothetical protein
MKEPNVTLLTIALASVSIVEAEEPATRARIVDVARYLFDAHDSDEEIEAAVVMLVSWGLVRIEKPIYCMTDAGVSLLSNCEEEARSQREHLEAVEKILMARLAEGSNTQPQD